MAPINDGVMKHQAWLGQLLNNDRNAADSTCDLVLESEGKQFKVHKSVLMLVSNYFRRMFTIEMKEKYEGIVKMQKIPHQRLANLIQFIYSGQIEIMEENMLDILDDAEYTEIEVLKAKCSAFLISVVSPYNCLKLRAYAQRYNLDNLLNKTNQTVAENFEVVVQHDDFKELDFEDVCSILNNRNKCFVSPSQTSPGQLSSSASSSTNYPSQMMYQNRTPTSRVHQSYHHVAVPTRKKIIIRDRNAGWDVTKNVLLSSNKPDFGASTSGNKNYNQTLASVSAKHEEAAFIGIVQWVHHHPLQREDLFLKLFSKLDLSLMSVDFLPEVYEEGLVKNNLVCLNLFAQASIKMNKKQADKRKSTQFLLVGGEDTEQDCVVYDVITKQARQLPKLQEPRCGATSIKVGSKVYVFGGTKTHNGKKPHQTYEIFYLNGQTRLGVIPVMMKACSTSGSGLIGDIIYVTGGYNSDIVTSCIAFNVHTKKWSSINDMLHARSNHGTVVCNDLLCCIGGWDGLESLSLCEQYDVASGAWNEIAPLNHARNNLACVVLNDNIYAIGGSCRNEPLNTVEKYEPKMNKWQMVGPLNVARSGSSACVIENKIYVIGGCDGENNLQSVEVYDPTLDVWTIAFETENPVYAATAVAI